MHLNQKSRSMQLSDLTT
uniref:Uncharacterized protein n=1 Tax=Arundo donax TaxID=35708 RepID=A0A0A8Y7J6_ARUDO